MNKKEDRTQVRIWKVGVLSLLLAVLLALTGCGKEAPEDYVKERLEKLQAGDEEMAEMLLQAGIESVDGSYVAAFPKDLKNRYQEFLKKACGYFTYTVKEAEAYNSDYRVKVEIAPAKVGDAVEALDAEYVQTLESTELTEAVETLLPKAEEQLETCDNGRKKELTLEIREKGSSYELTKDSQKELAEHLLSGYMEPYQAVAEVLDIRDYLQSVLDATYKGEVSKYARHTGSTEEQAREKYEKSFSGEELADMDLSAEQEQRFQEAMKKIFAGSRYEIGAMQKTADGGYVTQVTVTPNLSLQKSSQELHTNAKSGRYGSEAQLVEGYLTTLETYAQQPVYGEAMTVELHLSTGAILMSGDAMQEVSRLMEQILPS